MEGRWGGVVDVTTLQMTQVAPLALLLCLLQETTLTLGRQVQRQGRVPNDGAGVFSEVLLQVGRTIGA